MKRLLITAIISTIFFGIVLILYIVYIFFNDAQMMSLFGSLLGVLASVAFGFWISYAFQYVNDSVKNKKERQWIENVREREFSNIRYLMSHFIRTIYMREDQLLVFFPNLKCSFSSNYIDIDNLTLNYFVFDYYLKSEKFNSLAQNKKDQISKNVDVLFFRDDLGIGMNKSNNGFNMYESSESYEAFLDLNIAGKKLYENMRKINLDYNLDVFSKEEIDSTYKFFNIYGPGTFESFDPPYEIIRIFKDLLEIEKFVKSDFVPAYKKGDFWDNFRNREKTKQENKDMITNWKKNYEERAKDILEKL